MYAHYGCHVDDRPFALAHHAWQYSVYEVERALEVDVYNGIPLALGHAHHQAVFCDSCVVDKDVD